MKEWEEVYNDGLNRTCRLEVPGGWLYRNDSEWDTEKQRPTFVTMCFVPNPHTR